MPPGYDLRARILTIRMRAFFCVNARQSTSSVVLQTQEYMRPSVVFPVALLLCSCAQPSEQAGAPKSESAVAADSAVTDVASTKKETNGDKTRAGSAKTASSAPSAAPAQDTASSAKTKARVGVDTRCGIKGNPVL